MIRKNEFGEFVKKRKGLPRSNKPVILPESQTWLKNSNLITKISADYNLLQLKMLVAIVESLQPQIEKLIGGYKLDQLNLFEDDASQIFEEGTGQIIMLDVPFQTLDIPAQRYKDIRNIASLMATIPVQFDTKNPKTGEPCTCVTGLCKFYFPKKYGRCFTVVMDRQIATMFLELEKGIGFTKFMKEIAFKTSSKYTFRIYWLISSWKKKGGFSILLDKFRTILSLGDKYKTYSDLYKRVIRPVYEELFEKADVWFEVSEVYRYATDKEPYKLNFKVINGIVSEEEKLLLERKKQTWTNFCSTYLSFNANDRMKLERAMTIDNCDRIEAKIKYLYELVSKRGGAIHKINNYCLSILLKEAGVLEEGEAVADVE